MVRKFSVFFVHKEKSIPLIIAGVKAWPLEKAVEHAQRAAEITKIQTKIELCE